MSKAYLNFVLHNHTPFVRDLESSKVSEERWLFENMTNSQLPLLRMLRRLEHDRVPVSLTLSFSGTMTSMLSDSLLKEHYTAYLESLIELGSQEIERSKREEKLSEHVLAVHYQNVYQETLAYFKEVKGDLIGEYCYFANKGMIELVSSSLTHSFMPNYQFSPFSVDLQIKLGLELFQSAFGRESVGFWLPECGYYPTVEKFLKKRGIAYFFLDSHAILLSRHETPYGPYAPIAVGGVNAFVRDPYLQQFFSSAKNSYPRKKGYRDYYQDIGFGLPLEDLQGFVGEKNVRVNTGYKYYLHSETGEKTLYQLVEAAEQAEVDAQDFLNRIEEHRQKIDPHMKGREALFNVMCESDLFGCWWFEGVTFLEAFFRKAVNVPQVQVTTGSRYLMKYSENPILEPVHSSWGKNGFSEPWLNHDNDWISRLNQDMVEKLQDLLERYADTSSFQQNKMVLQAAKEVLLAQSSDWPFMIWGGHHVVYASDRVREHHDHFEKICNYLIHNKYDVLSFIQMEKKYNIMPNLSLRDLTTDVDKNG